MWAFALQSIANALKLMTPDQHMSFSTRLKDVFTRSGGFWTVHILMNHSLLFMKPSITATFHEEGITSFNSVSVKGRLSYIGGFFRAFLRIEFIILLNIYISNKFCCSFELFNKESWKFNVSQFPQKWSHYDIIIIIIMISEDHVTLKTGVMMLKIQIWSQI